MAITGRMYHGIDKKKLSPKKQPKLNPNNSAKNTILVQSAENSSEETDNDLGRRTERNMLKFFRDLLI